MLLNRNITRLYECTRALKRKIIILKHKKSTLHNRQCTSITIQSKYTQKLFNSTEKFWINTEKWIIQPRLRVSRSRKIKPCRFASERKQRFHNSVSLLFFSWIFFHFVIYLFRARAYVSRISWPHSRELFVPCII